MATPANVYAVTTEIYPEPHCLTVARISKQSAPSDQYIHIYFHQVFMGLLQRLSFCSVPEMQIGIIIYGPGEKCPECLFCPHVSFDNWLLLSLID